MGRHKRQIVKADGTSVSPSGKAVIETQTEKTDPLESLKTEYAERQTDVQSTSTLALDSEGEKPKRKRRTKAEIESERSAISEDAKQRYAQSAQAFKKASSILLDFLLRRMPDPLPASDEERELFSAAVGQVAEKYLPQAAGYDAELTLVAAALVVFAPRLVKEKPKPIIALQADSTDVPL